MMNLVVLVIGVLLLPAFAISNHVSLETAHVIRSKYSYLDPQKRVPAALLEEAVGFYDANIQKIHNPNFLSIIDFSQHSGKKRFYIIDMNTGFVTAIHTAHGRGSDQDHDGYTESYSNNIGSNSTSLGFYLTAEAYEGKHGYSLRLDGLSSTNSNARIRAIVIHGADYVEEGRTKQGRSWGCPAVAQEYRDTLIDSLKGGSLLYTVDKRFL